MKETKNYKSARYFFKRAIFYCSLSCFIVCCQGSSGELKQITYWEFRRVNVEINPETEVRSFKVMEEKFSTEELYMLEEVFKATGDFYKICTDSTILVTKSSMPDAKSMWLCNLMLENVKKGKKPFGVNLDLDSTQVKH